MSSHRRRLARLAGSAVLVVGTLLGAAGSVSAHVNRVVGPYTFFVVLIEEPYYADNRAGFEFWVHDGDRQLQGLDRTLTGTATSAAQQRTVDLEVAPLNNRGFYDLDTSPDGRPFDPGPGGDWVLRLTGVVESTTVDVTFPVTFPAYPRIAAHQATVPAVPAASASPLPLLAVIGVGVLGAIALAVAIARRRRAVGAPPESSPILPGRADIAQR